MFAKFFEVVASFFDDFASFLKFSEALGLIRIHSDHMGRIRIYSDAFESVRTFSQFFFDFHYFPFVFLRPCDPLTTAGSHRQNHSKEIFSNWYWYCLSSWSFHQLYCTARGRPVDSYYWCNNSSFSNFN